ncbi:MAG: prepilin-type N-terminal cleavage/methylation domain-containing protein [Smithella sp.]|jgi:prepilin-type N-terminal cleavage/methylation domain-containing protein
MSDKRGFTLVEILAALGIGAIMLAAIYSMINLSQKTSSGMERRVAAQQDEKTALELMAMEIGMASYNPLSVSDLTLWRSSACNAVTPNTTYKGIQNAEANSITIQMDINDNGTMIPAANNPNEIISYNYDAGNLYITRATNCGGAQPFLGDTATSGKTRTVRVINGDTGIYNPVIPVFRYFDGNNTEIAAPVTSSIPDIRRIEITLAVETEHPDPNNAQRKRMVYSTSVIVRNHVPAI